MTKSKVLGAGFLAMMGAAAAGCGGDPLIGTWATTMCPGTVPMGAMCRIEVTFNADTSFSYLTRLTMPAPVSCVQTARTIGLTYTSTPTTITPSGTATTVSEVTGCADPTMNRPAASTMGGGISATTYAISGNSLTLNQSGSTTPITLTRQ